MLSSKPLFTDKDPNGNTVPLPKVPIIDQVTGVEVPYKTVNQRAICCYDLIAALEGGNGSYTKQDIDPIGECIFEVDLYEFVSSAVVNCGRRGYLNFRGTKLNTVGQIHRALCILSGEHNPLKSKKEG